MLKALGQHQAPDGLVFGKVPDAITREPQQVTFDALARPQDAATNRLREITAADPQRAAQVIRKWLAEEAA